MAEVIVGRDEQKTEMTRAVEELSHRADPPTKVTSLEYVGPRGVGKTALLHQLEYICVEQDVPYVPYGEQALLDERAVKELDDRLAGGPLVLPVEFTELSPDEATKAEAGLATLFESHGPTKLFVVATSTSRREFAEPSLVQNVKPRYLGPLSPTEAEDLIARYTPIPEELRQTLYGWVGGHALALKTMADILITENLNPAVPADRPRLVARVTQRVVDEAILSHTSTPEARNEARAMLGLLSIPCRFDLMLLQELVEKFMPHFTRQDPLDYMGVPQILRQAAPGSVQFNNAKRGLVINESIRSVLSLGYRLGPKTTYRQTHQFLADRNAEMAAELKRVPGASSDDSLIYLREAWYHELKLQELAQQKPRAGVGEQDE